MSLRNLSNLINKEIERYNKRLIKYFKKDEDFSLVLLKKFSFFNRSYISLMYDSLNFQLHIIEFPEIEKGKNKLNFAIQLEINFVIMSKEGYPVIRLFDDPKKTYEAIKKIIVKDYKKFKMINIVDNFLTGFTPCELISNITLFFCTYIKGNIINYEEKKDKLKINFRHENKKGYLALDRKKEKVLISLDDKIVFKGRDFYFIDVENIFSHIKDLNK